MVGNDLGEATIVYEDPDEGTVERTVENEHVAYFQDHWLLKTGEDDHGDDLVRRIPVQRVHYVERSVAAFEEEVATLRDQVQSFAEDLRSRLLGGDSEPAREREEVYHIDVESGEATTGTTGSTEAGEAGDESMGEGGDESAGGAAEESASSEER